MQKQSETKPYRQGDVLLRRIDRVPEGATPVPRDRGRLILAYGEATGHCHMVEGEAELFTLADVEDLERRFLRVEAEVALVHDEHDTVVLPPGDYEQLPQVEHTPEEIRQVVD